MKKCPYCGESIKEEAVKCRFCNEWIKNKKFRVSYSKRSSILLLIIFAFVLFGGVVMNFKSEQKASEQKAILRAQITPSKIAINEKYLMNLVNEWERKQGFEPYIESQELCTVADKGIELLKSDWTTDISLKLKQLYNFPDLSFNAAKNNNTEKAILDSWSSNPKTLTQLKEFKKYSCIKCEETLCLQVFSNYTSQVYATQNSNNNSDPLVNCTVSINCGGGTRMLKKSICDQSVCCQIGSSWIFYESKDKCTQDQVKNNNPTSQQKSSGNNTYCWNNTYNYGYYTSSGDQCNKDNLQAGTYELCKSSKNLKYENCKSGCDSELQKNRTACEWGYTGANAGIEQNSDKYGECLNGEGGASEVYSNCLGKCTDNYAVEIKECNK